MKRLFSLFLTFLFIDLIFVPAGAEQIKIKTVDGVQVVFNPKNPSPPEGAPTRLILENDFSIGGSEKEEEMISQMTAVAVDSEGNIYVLDRVENNIKVFDSRGKYARAIGKQGQGPGEMNGPTGLRITPGNELLVEDVLSQRIAFFALDGKFLRNVSTAKVLGFSGVAIDSKGNMVAQQMTLADNKLKREVKKYDSNLNPLFTIASYDFPNVFEGKINPFSLVTFYELGSDNYIFFSNPAEYEIKVYNPEGKTVKRILKEYDPVKISEEDMQEFMARLPAEASMVKDRIEFPKFYPPYQSFSIDEQGRLLVRTYEKGKSKGEYFYDVFDAEGRYIARAALKGELRVWKGKKLYAVDETEDGFQFLRCYSVRWEKQPS